MDDAEDPYADRPPTPAEALLLASLDDAYLRRDASFIGGVYVERLRANLEALGRGEPGFGLDDPVETWLQIVWDGVDPTTGGTVDLEFWFDLIVAAADAGEDRSEAWCLADGPACHLLGQDEGMMPRLQALRSTHPGVDSMFRAYQEDLTSMGYELGWWGDDYVEGDSPT